MGKIGQDHSIRTNAIRSRFLTRNPRLASMRHIVNLRQPISKKAKKQKRESTAKLLAGVPMHYAKGFVRSDRHFNNADFAMSVHGMDFASDHP